MQARLIIFNRVETIANREKDIIKDIDGTLDQLMALIGEVYRVQHMYASEEKAQGEDVAFGLNQLVRFCEHLRD